LDCTEVNMGDMGEMFNAMRARRKERRRAALASADPTGWTIHTSYHWSRLLGDKRLDYWPSTNKWQYDGRVMTGNVLEFISRKESF